MSNPLRIYMGWDMREQRAYRVADFSLQRASSEPLLITPLMRWNLMEQGLLRRPVGMLQKGRHMMIYDGRIERRVVTAAAGGQMWDDISCAPMATEFAMSRFLVPILAQTGWCLFVDCDVVCMADPAELFALADNRYAVMCVKHSLQKEDVTLKMDGQLQTSYARKNWSSVILWNCDHPAHKALTLDLINTAAGRALHRFCWLPDDAIGDLPPEWNWLVNVTPRPAAPKLAHFTLGGPWLSQWKGAEHDNLWLEFAADFESRRRTGDGRAGAQAVPDRR